jgi:hypothetical protein
MHFIVNLFFIVGFIVVVLGLSILFGFIFNMFYDFKKTHNRGFDDLRRRNQKR